VVEERGRGRCRLTLASWPARAAAIARFDADIAVVGPPELTDAFAHLGRRLRKAAGGS
jgi:hypothetical protein